MLHPLTVIAKKDNDLVQALQKAGHPIRTIENILPGIIETVINDLPNKSGLAILSDQYPQLSLKISQEALDLAKKKKIRLFIEYPKSIPGLSFPSPKPIVYERIVVADSFLKKHQGPEKNSIIMANGCYYRSCKVDSYHLCLAVAAGYDHIVYGLPDKVATVLFHHHQ